MEGSCQLWLALKGQAAGQLPPSQEMLVGRISQHDCPKFDAGKIRLCVSSLASHVRAVAAQAALPWQAQPPRTQQHQHTLVWSAKMPTQPASLRQCLHKVACVVCKM